MFEYHEEFNRSTCEYHIPVDTLGESQNPAVMKMLADRESPQNAKVGNASCSNCKLDMARGSLIFAIKDSNGALKYLGLKVNSETPVEKIKDLLSLKKNEAGEPYFTLEEINNYFDIHEQFFTRITEIWQTAIMDERNDWSKHAFYDEGCWWIKEAENENGSKSEKPTMVVVKNLTDGTFTVEVDFVAAFTQPPSRNSSREESVCNTPVRFQLKLNLETKSSEFTDNIICSNSVVYDMTKWKKDYRLTTPTLIFARVEDEFWNAVKQLKEPTFDPLREAAFNLMKQLIAARRKWPEKENVATLVEILQPTVKWLSNPHLKNLEKHEIDTLENLINNLTNNLTNIFSKHLRPSASPYLSNETIDVVQETKKFFINKSKTLASNLSFEATKMTFQKAVKQLSKNEQPTPLYKAAKKMLEKAKSLHEIWVANLGNENAAGELGKLTELLLHTTALLECKDPRVLPQLADLINESANALNAPEIAQPSINLTKIVHVLKKSVEVSEVINKRLEIKLKLCRPSLPALQKEKGEELVKKLEQLEPDAPKDEKHETKFASYIKEIEALKEHGWAEKLCSSMTAFLSAAKSCFVSPFTFFSRSTAPSPISPSSSASVYNQKETKHKEENTRPVTAQVFAA